MIVATPRPGSPSRRARAPRYSISAEAFERLPHFSLSRSSAIAFGAPPSSLRGTKKQESRPSSFASVKKASERGTEQNHLWPTSS